MKKLTHIVVLFFIELKKKYNYVQRCADLQNVRFLWERM
jgi:hypothetical protein